MPRRLLQDLFLLRALILTFLLAAVAAQIFSAAWAQTPAPTPQPGASASVAQLRIGGAVSTPLVLTAADPKNMPRKTLTVVNPHGKRPARWMRMLKLITVVGPPA